MRKILLFLIFVLFSAQALATDITFNYTPVYYDGIDNCSIWANFSTTWQLNATNETVIVNNTVNNFTVALDLGSYLWNVECCYESICNFASSNYTLNLNIANLSLEMAGFQRDITAELGSIISISGSSLLNETLYLDINHPEYGTNYNSSTYNVTTELNISYFNLNTFSDTTSTQTLTENGSIDYTINNLTNMIYAGIDMNSTYGLSTQIQETANSTSENGNWYPGYWALVIDGNWTTLGHSTLDGDGAYGYINYTKPVDAVGGIWNIKAFGTGTYEYNIFDDYPDCWAQDELQFRLYSNWTSGTDYGGVYCMNSTGWQTIYAPSGIQSIYFYEEQMEWSLTNYTIDYTSDIILTYPNGSTVSYPGTLTLDTLNSTLFTYDSIENTTHQIFFDSAGTKVVTIEVPDHAVSYQFDMWGNDLDAGNDFSMYEYFINDSNLSTSNTNTTLYFIQDDFMTDDNTNFVTSGVGDTYSSAWDTNNQRYYSSASASASLPGGTCTTLCQDIGTSTIKFTTEIYNIEKYKKIQFYAYMATSAGANDNDNFYAYAYASGDASLILSADESLVSYTTIPGSSVHSGASGRDSDSDTLSGTYTLERNEDYGIGSYTFKSYKDGVLQGTTGVLSSGVDIGGYSNAYALAQCTKNYNCAQPSSSGGSTTYLYYLKLSGAGTEYILNNTYNTSAYYESERVFTAPNDISATTLTAREYKDSGCTIVYQLSNNNGSDWETVLSGTRHVFTSSGNELKWNANLECATNTTIAAIIEVDLDIIPGTLENITIDYQQDGTDDFTYNDKLNSTNSPQTFTLNTTQLGSETGTQTMSITSITPGVVTINNSILSSNMSPVILDHTLLEDCETCTLSWTFTDGSLVFNDLDIRYTGGNKTYTVSAHNADYSAETTYNITYYHSQWNDSLPPQLEYIDFFPQSVTSQNVQPFGQTSIQPIVTINSTAINSLPFTFSGYLNGTKDCVTLTLSPTNSKLNGSVLLNKTWVEIFSNLSYGESQGIWMWADFACSYGDWVTWPPEWYFKACAQGVDICEDRRFSPQW